MIKEPACFALGLYEDYSHASQIFVSHSFMPLKRNALCEAQMLRASKKYKIPVNILYAIALTETGQKQVLQPYALNINGKAIFPKTLQEALRLFHKAKRAKIRFIDIGCMQINEYYHRKAFGSLLEMFDPVANVDYAARFLKKLYKREGSWTMAVARYHAGPNNNPAQKRYICLVIHNMIRAGFGRWTKASKEFCEGVK